MSLETEIDALGIIGAVPSAAVEQLRAGHPAQCAESEELSWWQAMDEAALAQPLSLGYGPRYPTDAVMRFTEMLEARRPDLDAQAFMDLIAGLADEDRFVASIRKGDPVAALYYGLGFEASHTMPGRSGSFLLTAEEVSTVVPAADAILTMDALRRAHVVARIRAWFEVAGDESDDFDIDALVDGPLRILQRARTNAQGALALMQWY